MTKKRFQKIHLEIGNICNLQCSFCPPVDRKKARMGLELFSQALREAAPLTEQVCLHLMGEPLAHPEFSQVVDLCAQANAKIYLVTNGTLLREKHFATLLHPTLEQINFSLHSFSDNYPGKDPTDYLENIFRFVEQAQQVRPDLYLNFRVWNLQSLNSTHSASLDLLERIEKRFAASLRHQDDIRKKKYLLIAGRLYVNFDTEFQWPSLQLPVLGTQGTCYGLRSHFGILADGTVVPCCLDKEGVIPLGKIPEQTLAAILDSERAKRILHGFQKHRLEEDLCQRCQYITRFEKNAKSVLK